jgi:TonB family protein
MFESLDSGISGARRLSHPVFSLALHAGVIAFAIGQGTEPVPSGPNGGVTDPDVIYVHDGRGTAAKVEAGPAAPLPRPVCECPVIVPGPLPLDHPIVTGDGIEPGRLAGPVGHPGVSPMGTGEIQPAGLYREAELTDPPRLLDLPEPVYPPALRMARIGGVVQVTYVVNAGGAVEPESITVVTSDHPSMADAVRAALVRARFIPGKVRGTPVRSLVRQTIRFSLMSL